MLYVSPTAQQLLGYEPCELLGRNPSESAHPDDRVCIDAAMRQLSCSGAAELDYRFERRDGHFVWFHVLSRAARPARPDDRDGADRPRHFRAAGS